MVDDFDFSNPYAPKDPLVSFSDTDMNLQQDKDEEWGVVDYASDIGKGVVNSGFEFVDDIVSFAEDVTGWVTQSDQEWFDVWKPFDDEDLGALGQFTQEAGSFAIGLLLTGGAVNAVAKAGKLGKISKVAQWASKAKQTQGLTMAKTMAYAGEGAVADFVLGDTEGGNLGNLAEQMPMLEDSILTAFKHDEDDSALEKRFKNALEGVPLGIATDYLMDGLVKIFKHKKAEIKVEANGDPKVEKELIAKEMGRDTVAERASKSYEEVMSPLNSGKADMDDIAKGADALVENSFRTWEKMPVEEQKLFADDLMKALNDFEAEVPKIDSKGRAVFEQDILNRHRIEVDSPEDVMKIMNSVAELTGKHRRFDANGKPIPKQTFDETKELAFLEELDMYNDPEKALKNLKKSSKDLQSLRPRLLALRNVTVNSARKLKDLAEDVISGGTSEADLIRFAQQLDTHTSLQPLLQDITSEIGGLLSSQRIIVDGKPMKLSKVTQEALEDTQNEQVKRILEDFLDGKGGAKKLKDIANEVRRARVKKNGVIDIKELQNTLKHLEGNKALNVIKELRMTNILSGVSTQGVNIVGSVMHYMIGDIYEKMIASGLGALRGGTDKVFLEEAVDSIPTFGRGIGRFFKDLSSEWDKTDGGFFRKLTKVGEMTENISTDYMNREGAEHMVTNAISSDYIGIENKPLASLINAYGKTARGISFGVMNFTDTMFKHTGFESKVRQLLKHRAIADNWDKTTRKDLIENWTNDVVQYAQSSRLPKDISYEGEKMIHELYQAGLNHAKELTFQDSLRPKTFGRMMNNYLNQQEFAPQMLKTFVVPFFKTPMNILNFVKRRTPVLANRTAEYKQIMKTGTQVQKDMARAKILSGTTMYMGAMGLYQMGMLTGKHDDKERQALQQAGIPEYAVRIGDRYYEYNRLDPLGYFLGIIADLGSASRHMKQGEVNEAMGALVATASNNLVSKSYMKGLGDLWNVLTDYKRFSKSYMKNQVRAFIPLAGAQKSVNQVINPEFKEARSLVDSVMNNMVGFKGDLNVKLDALGEEVEVEPSPIFRMLEGTLGIRSRALKGDSDKARMEYAKYRAGNILPMDKAGTVQGVELSDEQHYEYKKLLGELGVHDKMNELVDSDFYKGANDRMRYTMLKRAMRTYTNMAKGILFSADTKLQKDAIAKKKFEFEEFMAGGAKTLMYNDVDALLNYKMPKFEVAEE